MNKILFVGLYLLCQTALAQGISSASGLISDSETGDPLPYIVIDMQYGGYASSSNSEGKFVFKFPTIVLDSEFVTFSSIGYESLVVPTKSLKLDSTNEIKLERAKAIETTLGKSEARVLVQAAVDSIQRNNAKTNFFQNGFYQESASIDQIGFVKLKEALIRVERFPQEEEVPDRIKVNKSRYLDWSGQSSKLTTWQFENGPVVACRTIETELPEFLTKKNLRDYEFRVDSMLYSYNGLELYSIYFEPKSARLRGGRIGKIFIEPNSKAIVRLEYELTDKGLSDVIGGGSGSVKLVAESLKFTSQYRWALDKWVLHENVILVDLEYQERLDRKFKAPTHWELRFLATETRDLSATMIKETEVLLSTENLRPGSSLETGFWESQNYLVPTSEMLRLTENFRRR